MINSLNNTALAGIQNGLGKLQENASQIASTSGMDGTGTNSLVESLVDLKANVQQVSASMKVLKVSDELMGTILDVKV